MGGLKPEDPEEFKEMQTKELQHCRLAMLAAAGMIVQELQTGSTLFYCCRYHKSMAMYFPRSAPLYQVKLVKKCVGADIPPFLFFVSTLTHHFRSSSDGHFSMGSVSTPPMVEHGL